MSPYEIWRPFINLFGGLEDSARIGAHGTGAGRWVKRPLTAMDVMRHIEGDGPGIGVPPLRPDSTVRWAAIDLDEPDFDAAREMQKFIPGTSWIEESRSGNAHILVFFEEPIEAWIPMGVLKEVITAAGKQGVEVFPKNHDFNKVRLGNYLNLCYHGNTRRVMDSPTSFYSLEDWVGLASEQRNIAQNWKDRARWLLIEEPSQRKTAHFGSASQLHRCAEYVIAHREERPITEGHRNAVYFMLAKCLTNWESCDHDEALSFMELVNDASPDRVPRSELKRILGNAERGEYTSTGCDDPLVQPFCDPACPISNGD